MGYFTILECFQPFLWLFWISRWERVSAAKCVTESTKLPASHWRGQCGQMEPS